MAQGGDHDKTVIGGSLPPMPEPRPGGAPMPSDDPFALRQPPGSAPSGPAPSGPGASAGVPLSATTYYFKDIDDLLTDTFAQYVERSAAFMGKLWVRNEGLLREMVAYGDGSPQSRSQLADDIAA